MLKKYFKDESYNIMPCGVVAFQNDSTLKIISANDYYYSTYANGNFESLNICEEDKNIIADLKDKNEVVYKCIVSDGTIRYICMHLTKYNENDILGTDLYLYNRMPGTVWGANGESCQDER